MSRRRGTVLPKAAVTRFWQVLSPCSLLHAVHDLKPSGVGTSTHLPAHCPFPSSPPASTLAWPPGPPIKGNTHQQRSGCVVLRPRSQCRCHDGAQVQVVAEADGAGPVRA
ncbi:hypothetical protein BDV95DRAFT_117447 [Massariosphaeria phaeospora]|uniref:Uncharacterized protein n=1 Tax=Massariosphaeria phaeospora TaxID=100035 RepID=A0A7C8I5F8_9PLEO|nr:hypothetical protein BDV95DRAFT_117447 [Massariosphaeria phaeospora]